jgi:enamine deaminase RidA (YjgF/YER057c/UK114 family)
MAERVSDAERFQAAVAGLRRGDFTASAPLFATHTPSQRCSIVRWLEAGWFGDAPDALREALTCACFLGETTVARELLAHGVDPQGGSGTGMNALHLPPTMGPYSQATRAGQFIFCAGQGGVDPTTGKLVVGGIREQTRQAIRNLQAILEAAGSDLSHVTMVTVLLHDWKYFDGMNEVPYFMTGSFRMRLWCRCRGFTNPQSYETGPVLPYGLTSEFGRPGEVERHSGEDHLAFPSAENDNRAMRTFTLEYWQDEGWYVGRLKEVAGVMSQGQTLSELEENIRDAYHLMTDTDPAPAAGPVLTRQIEV